MYEMLTGKPPFSGTTESLRYQHLNKAPPPLPLSVPPALGRLVTQLLAKELQARPTDVVQIRYALDSSSRWDEVPEDDRPTLPPTRKDRLEGGNRRLGIRSQELLNFCDQKWEIRLCKTQRRGWNTMMLQIRWNMFVVWIGCRQLRNVRMWP